MLGAARVAGRFRSVKSIASIPRSQPVRQLNGVSIGAVKETDAGEMRVVITPQNVTQLKKKGAVLFVEKGAGSGAGFSDAMYEAAGAQMVSAKEAWSKDLTLKVFLPHRSFVALA